MRKSHKFFRIWKPLFNCFTQVFPRHCEQVFALLLDRPHPRGQADGWEGQFRKKRNKSPWFLRLHSLLSGKLPSAIWKNPWVTLLDNLVPKRAVVFTTYWLQPHSDVWYREVNKNELQFLVLCRKHKGGSELNIPFATEKVKTLFIS